MEELNSPQQPHLFTRGPTPSPPARHRDAQEQQNLVAYCVGGVLVKIGELSLHWE